MIALDTNIIIRFLVRDDDRQAKIVYLRFKKAEENRERMLIPLLVVLETIWVLESAYSFSRKEILFSFTNLRQMPILIFENDTVLEKLLIQGEKTKMDLSDLLIALSAENLGCKSILSFDKKACKSDLFELLR